MNALRKPRRAARLGSAAGELTLDLEVACAAAGVPGAEAFRAWVGAALVAAGIADPCEVSVRVVDEAESAELNARYRGGRGATNVLSFPLDAPPEVTPRPLGDVVLCAPVVAREARVQGKACEAHWAHLAVHGTLHLLGYDHRDDAEAGRMEPLEARVLARFGFPDPYRPPGAVGR